MSPERCRRWYPSSSTSWWDKSEWNWKWAHKKCFKWPFCYSWFRLQSIAIHCNRRGGVDRYTSHVIFLMQFAQFISCISHCVAQVSVCARHSIFTSSVMSVWSSVRCPSLRVCLSPVSLCCLPLLFLILPVLWLALLHPCGQRRGKHPLRLRPMRSIAAWRYTILSHLAWVWAWMRLLLRFESRLWSSFAGPFYFCRALCGVYTLCVCQIFMMLCPISAWILEVGRVVHVLCDVTTTAHVVGWPMDCILGSVALWRLRCPSAWVIHVGNLQRVSSCFVVRDRM